MKKITKSALCFLLAIITVFSLSGCSKVQMTEDNILQTVIDVETALKDFDEETLKKYVDSKTLDVIIQYAEKHIQFEQLGTRIFESMSDSPLFCRSLSLLKGRSVDKNFRFIPGDVLVAILLMGFIKFKFEVKYLN